MSTRALFYNYVLLAQQLLQLAHEGVADEALGAEAALCVGDEDYHALPAGEHLAEQLNSAHELCVGGGQLYPELALGLGRGVRAELVQVGERAD